MSESVVAAIVTSLNEVRTFTVIVEQGSFTRAAEALGISLSQVSRQLSALESQMGVQLLGRTTRSLKLTETGRRFYEQSRHALTELDQAIEIAIKDTNTVQGRLRVNSVGGPVGESVITELICGFLRAHPKVEVNLDFSSPRIDLVSDDFDVAFRMGELNDADYVARELGMIRFATLASPQYLTQVGHPVKPEDLIHHDCLTGSVSHWQFVPVTSDEKSREVIPNSRLQCKSGRALVKAALAGQGIIRMPVIYCRDAIDQGELVPVFQDWQNPDVPLSMIYHRHRFQSHRLTAFVQHVISKFDPLCLR